MQCEIKKLSTYLVKKQKLNPCYCAVSVISLLEV